MQIEPILFIFFCRQLVAPYNGFALGSDTLF